MSAPLDVVVLGLSLSSSWGNGHATTYRALLRELHARGHRVRFLERELPFYAAHRDLAAPPYCALHLYDSVDELMTCHHAAVARADLVIVGSYVPEGVRVGHWVTSTARGLTAFYDIDTPVTLKNLAAGDTEYLSPELIPCYDIYLSFTGGPTLTALERTWGSPCARPLYCSVDPSLYYPEVLPRLWDLGYLGTYSNDRQPPLDALLLEPARRARGLRFMVAGPQYPASIRWPGNVERIDHLPPADHRAFYNQQQATLNVTRRDMVEAGYSPSVRLFEAAACGTPILSDAWPGLGTLFTPDREILITRSPEETLAHLHGLGAERRGAIGQRARARVLAEHTSAHRAETLEGYALALLDARSRSAKGRGSRAGAGLDLSGE